MEDSGEPAPVSELFMELGSEIRCSMLVSLSKEPAKLSTLARKFDITVQHAHQNVNRLYEAGLVERNDGTFQVTEFGRMVTMQIPYFLFIKRHSKFFEDHTLGGIPEKFVQRIGALQNCRTVSSATVVFQSLKKIQSSAGKSLKVIVSQAWPEEGEIFIDRANHGAKILALVGHNTIFPRNVIEHIMPTIKELTAKGLFERRMVEKVSIAIFIVDNREAALVFPNKRDEVDMANLFVSDDPSFCEWCSDYFDYNWERSETFDIKNVKIAEY